MTSKDASDADEIEQLAPGRDQKRRKPLGGVASDDAIHAFASRFFKSCRHPRLVIDSQSRVQWSTPGAERQLVAPLPLRMIADRLVVDGEAGAKSWAGFIDKLGPQEDRLLLSSGDGLNWVLVRGWAEKRGADHWLFLHCHLSRPLLEIERSGLAAQFGLTRTECAVLERFALLERPRRIAEHLGISVSTVRSHLKQIHSKMAVRSSVQLLQLTRAFCDD